MGSKPESSSSSILDRIAIYALCLIVPVLLVLVVITVYRGITAGFSSLQSKITPAGTSAVIPPPSPPTAAAPAAPMTPEPPPATQPVQAAASQPTSQPADDAADTLKLDQTMVAAVQSAVQSNQVQCSPVVGGAFGQYPFQDVEPDGILIGFEIGMGKFFSNDVIHSVQPIYLTPTGEKLGKHFGVYVQNILRVAGPPGYAVGAATIRGGAGLDGLTVTFMRIRGDSLDPNDAYISTRLGGTGGGDSYIGGDGTPVVGICGKANEKGEWLGLGLVFLQPTPAAKPH